jgi:hypothetical protein
MINTAYNSTYYVIGKQTITYHQWAPLINTYYVIGKQTITYHQWAPLINTYYVNSMYLLMVPIGGRSLFVFLPNL